MSSVVRKTLKPKLLS